MASAKKIYNKRSKLIRGLIFGMLIGLHIWGCIFLGIIYGGCINRILWYCKRFSLKITNKSCNNRLKYCKFTRKIIKGKHVVKKIILKDNITTRYTEYNTKILELVLCPFAHPIYSVLIHPQNVEKTTLLKPSFGLSVEI